MNKTEIEGIVDNFEGYFENKKNALYKAKDSIDVQL